MKYFFLVFFLIFTSCISEENLDLQTNSKYQGNYVGNFSGELSGEINFNVSNTGNLEGIVYYNNVPDSSQSISGYVMTSGKFNATAKSGLNFIGYLYGTTMNGKWTKGNLTGDYEFHKK
ncbi:hypothetical protein [Chryseobacterium vrystaatense]|uniref:Uncharacterized protein n=1 Tax=Chryseobacterium vrystaatense TaxID=307480 RepID=A0A1M5HDB2_9FLAO|nr:hypothetical protein [Chryseobacterium vrystaatense]SHG13924.1 hypothetical protein SAMN02787073_3666 [Chryseobacterium vrystaatense]